MKAIRYLLRDQVAIGSGLIIMVFVLSGLFAGTISPYNPLKQNLRATLDPPSAEHWMGTDYLGRDIFSRIIHGSRITLTICAVAVSVSTLIGVLIGIIAGYFGGPLGQVLMRTVDILMAFPSILLALVTVSILGTGLTSTIIAIGISGIPRFALVSRSMTLVIKEQLFVEAAQSLGRKAFGIIRVHILPNILAPLIVQSTIFIAQAILIGSGLGFLGLGAQPPKPEWGTMLSDARGLLQVAPHVVVFPGMAILVVSLSFNLLGDRLRDALDIRD
jgi:peptide/nickel transport system permease protein